VLGLPSFAVHAFLPVKGFTSHPPHPPQQVPIGASASSVGSIFFGAPSARHQSQTFIERNCLASVKGICHHQLDFIDCLRIELII
jgi:hypothetical protein